MKSFVCKSEEALLSLGGRLGREMRRRNKEFLVVLLSGDVGAGKSCFARGCIRSALGNENEVVNSPTFVLLNTYRSDEQLLVHHLDLYRIRDVARVKMLGIPAMCQSGHVLIEWHQLVERVLRPFKDRQMLVEITSDESDCRFVSLTGPKSWIDNL
jgi:tRNA threonylcarbamoyladenosine biosynthesis protein TsaE